MLACPWRGAFPLAVALLDLNRNRPARALELSPVNQLVHVQVVHVKQIGMSCFERTEKLIEHTQGRIAKVFQRRMEIDGMYGNNRRDAALEAAFRQLHVFFQRESTLEGLNVDGAMSTNDTAMLLSSGKRGAADLEEFGNALLAACEDLTMQMARDAEGMTRIARLCVTGASNDNEAKIAAKAIAENNLVKCSWYGGDPYWGRLLAAAGSCGVALDVGRSRVSYGGITVAEGGTSVPHDGQALAEHMMGDEIAIEVHLGAGNDSARMIGIDLGPGYIKENSRTS